MARIARGADHRVCPDANARRANIGLRASVAIVAHRSGQCFAHAVHIGTGRNGARITRSSIACGIATNAIHAMGARAFSIHRARAALRRFAEYLRRGQTKGSASSTGNDHLTIGQECCAVFGAIEGHGRTGGPLVRRDVVEFGGIERESATRLSPRNQ